MARRNNNEGTIAQRADGRWAVALSLGTDPVTGKRIRKSSVKKTKKEAQAQLKEWHAANDAGQDLTTDSLTVAKLMGMWLEKCETNGAQPKTMRSYRQMADLYIVPRLGTMKVTKADAQTIQLFLADVGRTGSRGKPIGTESVRRVWFALHAAFDLAVRWRVITRNTVADTDPPKKVKYQAKVLTPDEAKKLLSAIPETRYGSVFAVMLGLGLRPAEVAGLRWQDVKINPTGTGGTLNVCQQVQFVTGGYRVSHPKTLSGVRCVPLPDFVAAALIRRRAEQEAERRGAEAAGQPFHDAWKDLVFTGLAGLPISQRYVVRKFHELGERIGIKETRLYDLRHTCVSFLAAAGVPPSVIGGIVGHSQISTTMDIYSHVLDGSKVIAADAMSQMMSQTQGKLTE